MEQSNKRKKRLRTAAILAGLLAIAFIANLIRTLPGSAIKATDIPASGQAVLGASSEEGYFTSLSTGESGLFYLRNNLMRYYDLAADRSYVLCSRPNCPHLSSVCNAWYTLQGDVVGLAQYGDFIYAIKRNGLHNSYDLVSMDLSGNVQKTVYSLDIGDVKAGSWWLTGIYDMVYYAGGHVWFKAWYSYVGAEGESDLNAECLIGINLADGSRIDLAGLPLASGYSYEIDLASNDCIAYNSRWESLPMLSEPEFYEAYERGEYPDVDGMEPDWTGMQDPYYKYHQWHRQNSDAMFTITLYDIVTGQAETFADGVYYIDEYDNTLPVYILCGYYQGLLIYSMPVWSTDWRAGGCVYAYDTRTGQRQLLVDFNEGDGSCIFANAAGCVTSEGLLLLDREVGDTDVASMAEARVMIYSYSLVIGEMTDLYEDSRQITFRIFGETADSFIGRRVNSQGDDLDPGYYIIAKDDYCKGDLAAARKLGI